MTATFYTFAKRPNSTARPSGGTSLNIVLKSGCSVLSPSLEIRGIDNPTAYNYMYLPSFGRYYYIAWTWDLGVWTASGTVDTLASWRTQIGDCSEYIVRSSAKQDGNVIDALFPTTSVFYDDVRTATSNPYTTNYETEGMFVISTINGGDVGHFGGASFFAVGASTCRALFAKLLTSTDFLNIDESEVSAGLTKALFNPIDYITKVFWLPIGTPAIGTPIDFLPLGWWSFSDIGNVYVVQNSNDMLTVTTQITVPKHNQATVKGAYCNGAPYARYWLFIPPWGNIPIDSAALYSASTLYVKIATDLYTGDAQLYLSTDSAFNSVFLHTAGNIAVSVQVGQITQDVSAVASPGGIIKTVAGGLLGAARSFLSGAVNSFINGEDTGGSISSGIVSGAEQATAEVQSGGSTSAIACYGVTPYLRGRFFQIVQDDNNQYGRPLCQVSKISDLPGYLLINNPDVGNVPATSDEIDTIRRMMAAGFYYE